MTRRGIKVERRMSNINQAVERGVKGEALHVPPDNETPCDIDDGSHVDDQETLRGKIVSRLIQIESTVSGNRDLPDDVKQKVGCHPAGVLSVRRERCYSAARSQTRHQSLTGH